MTGLVRLARRAMHKPPRVVARRALQEVARELERVRAPRRAAALRGEGLARALGAATADAVVRDLLDRPFPAVTTWVDPATYERACPGDADRILDAAARAARREVDLLGSGPVRLGTPVDWHRDPKTDARWPATYGPRLEYARLDEPCDVKLPWEISRLQWTIPLGQAYLLTREERWAAETRTIVAEWIDGNPYPMGPNWAIAMEPALRLVTLTWLLRAFRDSTSWDCAFQADVARALVLHADFVDRHLEEAEVNGNHFDADAMALVVAGSMLGAGAVPRRWAVRGWDLLVAELPRQVTDDGVDFEASAAYHRLVCELFLLPAALRRAQGRPVPRPYADRLLAMATFARAYTREDGTTPLWGDADDARVLPFGPQAIGDHRYLPALVEASLGLPATIEGPRAELAWVIGAEAAADLPEASASRSRLFPDGGVAVMRGCGDHVFVDCGPVGLAGRGGHGHNDCLSLEVALDGTLLVTDSGSYVYTAAPAERERFRATAAHATPQIDGEELNRHVGSLWMLANDALPDVRSFETGGDVDRLVASHSGYRRLPRPVIPVRTVILDRGRHLLVVEDAFEDGEAESHAVRIPWPIAAGIDVERLGPGQFRLREADRRFALRTADPGAWESRVEQGWVSPSYGVRHPRPVVVFERRGDLRPLVVVIGEEDLDLLGAAEQLLARRFPMPHRRASS